MAGRCRAQVRVSFRDDEGLLVPGARVGFKAVLLPPPAPAAPGDYDFGRAAYFEGLGAVGYAYGPPELLAPAPPPDFAERIVGARAASALAHVAANSCGASGQHRGDCIRHHHGRSRRHFGGRTNPRCATRGSRMCSRSQGCIWRWSAWDCSGPCAPCSRRSRASRSLYPIKKWSAVAALFGAGFYLVISGAAAATTRAFIMLAMMLLAILVDQTGALDAFAGAGRHDHSADRGPKA